MKDKFRTIAVSVTISLITVGIYFASIFVIKTAASHYSPMDTQDELKAGMLSSNLPTEQAVTSTASFTAIPVGRHLSD